MPTWASADRTVQRGCEPKAMNPLQGEKRERGRFLAPAILAQNEIFSISLAPGGARSHSGRFAKFPHGSLIASRAAASGPCSRHKFPCSLSQGNQGASD